MVSSLAHLDIGYNNIGVEGVKHLVEAIRASGSLTVLDLRGCNIGDEES